MADRAFYDGEYISRAWAMITRKDGWKKTVVTFGVLCAIPVVGFLLGLMYLGVSLNYGSLAAWNYYKSFSRTRIDPVSALKMGAGGFVVCLGWGVPVAIVSTLLSVIGGVNEIVGIVTTILTIAVCLLGWAMATVACMRAAIYHKVSAGFGFSQIFYMAKRGANGLARIILITAAIATGFELMLLVVSVLAYMMLIVTTGMSIQSLVGALMGDVSTLTLANQQHMALIGGVSAVLAFITAVATSIIACAVSLITFTCVGLWMRQFDVNQWGDSAEPVPGQNLANGVDISDDMSVREMYDAAKMRNEKNAKKKEDKKSDKKSEKKTAKKVRNS